MPSDADTEPSDIDHSHYKFDRFAKGANWDPENVRTILQWVHIAAINLDVMTEASVHYKRFIRRNTILSLIFSTLASTASLSQFNLSQEDYPNIDLSLKILFTIFATAIAISTGYLKIYQIQEKLEKAIKLQQEWTAFGSTLSSELQLPLELRKDALYLIVKHKDTYTELFKQQIDVSQKIIQRVATRNGLKSQALSLSELFERVLEAEAERMQVHAGEIRQAMTPLRREMDYGGNSSISNHNEEKRMHAQDILKRMFEKKLDKIQPQENRCRMSEMIMKPQQYSTTAPYSSEPFRSSFSQTRPSLQKPVSSQAMARSPLPNIKEDFDYEKDKDGIILTIPPLTPQAESL